MLWMLNQLNIFPTGWWRGTPNVPHWYVFAVVLKILISSKASL